MPYERAEDVDAPYPQYRCPVDGEDLPLTEARITVTCERHRPHEAPVAFEVRDAGPKDRAAIELICDRVWGETDIDCFGRTFDVLAGHNLVAISDGELAGLISLALDRGEQAIVMLSVYPQFQGGAHRAVEPAAHRRCDFAPRGGSRSAVR